MFEAFCGKVSGKSGKSLRGKPGKQQNNTRAMMADNNRDLQSIVNNVVNHPQFRLLLSDAVETSRSASEASQRNQLTSTGTNPTSNSNSTPNGGNGRSTYSSPVEEFNSIFRFGVTRQQQGAGTVSSFTPRSTSRGRTQSLNSRRSRRYSPTATATSATRNTAFTREVVLLSDPTASATVRGNDKADLIKKGQVISDCDFNRSWTEEEVFGHIRQAFLEKLEGRR